MKHQVSSIILRPQKAQIRSHHHLLDPERLLHRLHHGCRALLKPCVSALQPQLIQAVVGYPEGGAEPPVPLQAVLSHNLLWGQQVGNRIFIGGVGGGEVVVGWKIVLLTVLQCC